MSQGASDKCKSPKKGQPRRGGWFGNFSCHFRAALWAEGVLGRSSGFSKRPGGGDPGLPHPGQRHLSVQADMWMPNLYSLIHSLTLSLIHSFNKYLLRTYYLPDVTPGSRGAASTRRPLCPHRADVLMGKTDKINKQRRVLGGDKC